MLNLESNRYFQRLINWQSNSLLMGALEIAESMSDEKLNTEQQAEIGQFTTAIQFLVDQINTGEVTIDEANAATGLGLVVTPAPWYLLQRGTKECLLFSCNKYSFKFPLSGSDYRGKMHLSVFRKLWNHSPVDFPPFTGLRIMMMPVRLGDLTGVPEQYHALVEQLYGHTEHRWHGHIGYLTIDERTLVAGETMRRPGLHVDGYYQGSFGVWGGGPGPGGGWGSVGNGMLTVSNTSHCQAWLGAVYGEIGPEGEADKLNLRTAKPVLFEPGQVYWLDGGCVHESLPVREPVDRVFVRLSMPSSGPWFEGYTENPDPSIKPSNDILPRRDTFMENKNG